MSILGRFIIAIGSIFLAGCTPEGSLIEDGFLGGVKISGEYSRVSSAKSSLSVGEATTVLLEIRDKNGFPFYIPNSNPAVVFYVSSGSGGGTFSSVTNYKNGSYSASFFGVTAGTATISASIDGLIIPSATSILVSPATFSTANSYVSLSGGSVASGSSVSVTLYTRDSSNNPVYTTGLSVSFNLSGGTGTGTFSATTDNGDGSYSATFTGVLAGSASQVRGVVGATALTSVAPSVTVTAGAASQISVSSGGSQTGTVGLALGSPLVALVTDAAGNPVNGVTVNWTRSGGSLASASSTTNAAGLASNTFTLSTIAGSYTATATIQGTSTSVNFNATASPGAATQLSFTTQPVGGVGEGALLSAQPTVEIRDTHGNRVTSGPDATANVSLSLTSGTGSLGGSTSMAAVGGVAAFTDISVSFSGNKVITATKANTIGSGGTASMALASSAFTVNDTISPSAPGTPSWSASVWGSTSTTPTLSWTAATDTNGSGVSYYEVALGTSAGATNTVGWTNVGNVISYSFSGLSLSNGTSYFASVRAVDGAANAGSPANSGAFAVDSTLPAAPTSVTDGSVTSSLSATPAISWVASASSASPNFGGYELAIGTTAGATDTLAWTDVGNVTSYTPSTGITLIDGTVYYATVRAYKTTGLRSAAVNGDGFVVNTSSPSLSCDFITNGGTECRESGQALAPLLRLGRAGGSNTSPGTYVDSSGIIRNALTNLLLRSEESDVSPWISTGLNAFGAGSVTNTSAVKDPSGANGAEYLQEDTSTTNHGIYQNVTASPAVSYTCSVFAKAAERQMVRMVLTDGAGSNYVEGYFDLSVGTTAGLGYNGGGNSGSLGISSYPNGWYRLRITGIPATSGTTTGCNIRMVRNVGDTVYTGNGVSGLYVWGAQLETGTSASSYIYTASTVAYGPRIDHDPSNCPSGVCARKGLLLEGTRVNMVANSAGTAGQTPGNSLSTTYTVSSELAPDGSGNFLKCTEGGTSFGSVGHACRWLITMGASTTYTASAYVKTAGRTEFTMLAFDTTANGSVKIDLTNGTATHCNTGLSSSSGIKAVGNGVYRVWITFTTPASPTSNYFDFRLADGGAYGCVGDVYTGDGSSGIYLWGLQLEAGGFPSSYIPTSGGTRTRNSDTAFTPGSGWLDAAKGTLIASGRIAEPNYVSLGSFPFLAAISDSSSGVNDASLYFREVNSSKACRVNRSGSTEFTTNTPHSFSSVANLALAYQASDASCYAEGSSVGSSTSPGVPAANGLYLGSTSATVGSFVHIRSVNYYNSRLNNSKLRYLSLP